MEMTAFFREPSTPSSPSPIAPSISRPRSAPLAGRARTPWPGNNFDERVANLISKLQADGASSLGNSLGGSTCSGSHKGSYSRRPRPHSAREWMEQRFVESASSNKTSNSSCAATISTNAAVGVPKRPVSARPVSAGIGRRTRKDHLSVQDAQTILSVLQDAKRRQLSTLSSSDREDHASIPGTSSSVQRSNGEYRTKAVGNAALSSAYSHADRTRSASSVASAARVSSCSSGTPRQDARFQLSQEWFENDGDRSSRRAAKLRVPQEWLESCSGWVSVSSRSQSGASAKSELVSAAADKESCGGGSSSSRLRSGANNGNVLVNAAADAEKESLAGLGGSVADPPLWQLQTGPERALWGRHKKTCKHGNYNFATGPWANRTGTGSIVNYKQWGPAGPQFAIQGAAFK